MVVFKNIGVDNPMINGIILYYGGLEDTDFPHLKEIFKQYDYKYDKM